MRKHVTPPADAGDIACASAGLLWLQTLESNSPVWDLLRHSTIQ